LRVSSSVSLMPSSASDAHTVRCVASRTSARRSGASTRRAPGGPCGQRGPRTGAHRGAALIVERSSQGGPRGRRGRLATSLTSRAVMMPPGGAGAGFGDDGGSAALALAALETEYQAAGAAHEEVLAPLRTEKRRAPDSEDAPPDGWGIVRHSSCQWRARYYDDQGKQHGRRDGRRVVHDMAGRLPRQLRVERAAGRGAPGPRIRAAFGHLELSAALRRDHRPGVGPARRVARQAQGGGAAGRLRGSAGR
jgi:hypothetical protein